MKQIEKKPDVIETEKIRALYWKAIDIHDAIYEEYYNRQRAKGRWKNLKKFREPTYIQRLYCHGMTNSGGPINLEIIKHVLESAAKWARKIDD